MKPVDKSGGFTNVITQKDIKQESAEKTDMAPQKGAFDQITAIIEKLGEQKGKLDDEMKELQQLIQNFDGSPAQKKQIDRLVQKLGLQMENVDQSRQKIEAAKSVLDAPVKDSEGDSGTISITAGYLAEAMAIALELQDNWVKMKNLYLELVKMSTEATGDRIGTDGKLIKGTVVALAEARRESFEQDSINQKLEAGRYIGQAVTMGVSTGVNVQQNYKMGQAIKPHQDSLKNLQAHDQALATASSQAKVSNRPDALEGNPEGQAQMQERISAMRAGKFDKQFDPNNPAHNEAFNHIKRDEAMAREVGKNILKRESTEHSQIQAKRAKFEDTKNFARMGTDMLAQTTNATMAGLQSEHTTEKGRRESQAALAQNASENLNQTKEMANSKAREAQDQAAKELQVREALSARNRA